MASDIVPGDVVVVLVVEDSQACLIVKLLKAFDRDANVELGGDGTLGNTLVVVGLGFARFSTLAPEAFRVRLIGRQDPLVVGSCPEPAIDVDGLKVGSIATLALEVTLAARSVDGADVILSHDSGKKLVFPGSVEADEIHATISAKVSSVKPIPILKLVPRLSPGQEVIVSVPYHVRNSFFAFFYDWSIEQRFSIRSNPCWLLSCRQEGTEADGQTHN